MFLQEQHSNETLTLRLTGRWSIENAAAIDAELRALRSVPEHVTLDAGELEHIDLTGAWILLDRLKKMPGGAANIRWQGEVPDAVTFVGATLKEGGRAPAAHIEATDMAEPIRSMGRWATATVNDYREALVFFGRLCATLGGALAKPGRLRLPSLIRHVYETGVQAIPIVSLIAFLISIIIAYMGAQQLRKFGAEIFVVDLVTVGVLRELGVLLTAIIVAGRSGSAFAAEIGVMKLNDEVDALRAIGTEPAEVLVLPRVLGLVIALPLLTIVADAVGLLGGGLLSYYLLDMSPLQYVTRMQESIASTTFWVGLMKAPVFAVLIAFVGTLRGMQVRDSSRELGRLTTVAVVQSIFLVIFADAIFAVIFMELDI